jgi:CoA-transferase family III
VTPVRGRLAGGGDFRIRAPLRIGRHCRRHRRRWRRIAHRLIRKADVLVENFSVGATARMGIDYDTVHRLNPDLLSGLAAVTGYPGGQPIWSGVT